MNAIIPTRRTVLSILLGLSASATMAASITPQDLAQLATRADKDGAVPVVVHLAPVSLQDLNKNLATVKKAMAQKGQQVRTMLGREALQGGQWENGIGQIGLHVTTSGLKLLKNSSLAVSFYPDMQWYARSHVSNADGSLSAIDALLQKDGAVDVSITMNVDGMGFHMDQQGRLELQTASISANGLADTAKRVLQDLSVSDAPGKDTMLQQLSAKPASPQITLRVNREGLLKLAANPAVRKLAPAAFVDTRARSIDPAIATHINQYGTARVLLTLRNPLPAGNLSKASWSASNDSNQRMLNETASGLQLGAKLDMIPAFGVMAANIGKKELERIIASNDARLLSVQLDKAIPASLATSTATINMPHIWSLGYRGAGQTIVVMDTGVEKNHPFFRSASGASRIVTEACFGTSILFNGTNFQSVCPSPDATEDSIGPGTALPVPACSSIAPVACLHGTHVAGIAAGRNGAGIPLGLQGIAPDANLLPVQVFSYDAKRQAVPQSFYSDQLRALQLLASVVTQGSTNNPYTVNLSLGGGIATSPCNDQNSAYGDAIITLKNLGIPVITATGNNGNYNGTAGHEYGISFPACLTGTIKVTSESNDGVGGTRSTFANMPMPSQFPGEVIWMAPGGNRKPGEPGYNHIVSSVTSGGFAGYNGTSMAAPHIAGVYAALKAAVPGISVNDASSWILNNASQTVNMVILGQNRAYKRIRLP